MANCSSPKSMFCIFGHELISITNYSIIRSRRTTVRESELIFAFSRNFQENLDVRGERSLRRTSFAANHVRGELHSRRTTANARQRWSGFLPANKFSGELFASSRRSTGEPGRTPGELRRTPANVRRSSPECRCWRTAGEFARSSPEFARTRQFAGYIAVDAVVHHVHVVCERLDRTKCSILGENLQFKLNFLNLSPLTACSARELNWNMNVHHQE